MRRWWPLNDVQRNRDYLATFGTEPGRRTLESLFRYTGGNSPLNDTDPYRTAFNCGARSVWLHLQRVMALTSAELVAIEQATRERQIGPNDDP